MRIEKSSILELTAFLFQVKVAFNIGSDSESFSLFEIKCFEKLKVRIDSLYLFSVFKSTLQQFRKFAVFVNECFSLSLFNF